MSYRQKQNPFWLWMLAGVGVVAVVGWFARLLRPSLATLPELARRHGARFIETPDVNGAATLAAVQAYAPDFIVVMNFDQILQPPLIAVPRIAAVNVHPGLLPDLRERFAKAGSVPMGSTPEQLRKRYEDWMAIFGRIAADAGVKPQ